MNIIIFQIFSVISAIMLLVFGGFMFFLFGINKYEDGYKAGYYDAQHGKPEKFL